MVTIKNIATELGLSHSVISRALNPNPDKNARVSPKTKALVMKTAEDMGFRRNRIAEFMKRGKAATIGVFMPEYSNRLGADLMIGISEAATEHGFPCNFYFGMCLKSFEEFILENIENPCSGIISYPFYKGNSEGIEELFQKYTSADGKAILLNTTGYPKVPSLYIDEVEGVRIAANHLVQCNCSRYLVDSSRMARSEAFQEYLNGEGLRDRCEWFDPEEFAGIIARIATNPDHLPLGVFAVTDENAAAIIRKINNTELRFGKDVFLVGYDDLQLASQLDPPLTTIHQPFRKEGRRAVEKLISIIYGDTEADESITPFLVKRETA